MIGADYMKKQKRELRTASLKHERKYYSLGYQHVFGIDEVGRGPWAGPVTAGAVCLPLGREDLSQLLKGVRDSKQMTPLQRETLSKTIKDTALAWGIGNATAVEIDDVGIVPATMLAMQRAVESALKDVDFDADCLFIDDMLLPELRQYHQVSLIEGDARCLSIACASVVAKVWRDAYMVELDAQYPQYGFAEHKGYGTPQHIFALKQYGASEIHRTYYKPVQTLTKEDAE